MMIIIDLDAKLNLPGIAQINKPMAIYLANIKHRVCVARKQAVVVEDVVAHVISATARAHNIAALLHGEELRPDHVLVDGLFIVAAGGGHLELERLARVAGERGQAFDGQTRHQGLVAAVELGHGLLDQRHPELLAACF